MQDGEGNGRGDAPIGAVLERTRRERGLSLRDVEDATKIRTRYLDGLEREDFSVLPDAVYVQGFLKTYANFLGLDGEGLAREMKARRWPRRERYLEQQERPVRRSEREKPLVSPGGLAGAERRRIPPATILAVALAVLVLALVIGFLYLIGSRSAAGPETPGVNSSEQPVTPGAPEPPDEQQDASSAREEPPAREEPREQPPPPADEEPPEETAAESVSVTVRVPDTPVGMTVTADGAVVSDVLARPGFTQTFEAQEVLQVSTANAGAVEVEVDGQNLGRLGYSGQPLTRDFTPSS